MGRPVSTGLIRISGLISFGIKYLSLLKLLLSLPELGQVDGGDLLRLLDLLLVGLDLTLQLVDQSLHPLVVLAVLVLQDIDNELIWFFFF